MACQDEKSEWIYTFAAAIIIIILILVSLYIAYKKCLHIFTKNGNNGKLNFIFETKLITCSSPLEQHTL